MRRLIWQGIGTDQPPLRSLAPQTSPGETSRDKYLGEQVVFAHADRLDRLRTPCSLAVEMLGRRRSFLVASHILSLARYGLSVLTGFGGLGTGGSFGGAAGIVDTPQMFRAPIA